VNREVTLPLIVDDRGTLQVAAADVSKLLRRLGGRWVRLVEEGEQGLDEDTVAALAIELAKLADRIDVACIAHSSGS
jgi:cobalamin biosynthesis Mg chelatase CobN